MGVLGIVIDGFVIGNYMGPTEVAASGLVSPVVILFSIVTVTTGAAFQIRALGSLARGDVEAAGKGLTAALTVGVIISLAVTLLIFIFSMNIAEYLGDYEIGEVARPCSDYLIGIAVGLPAMTVMAILTRSIQMEGRHKLICASVAVMAAVSGIGDILCITLLHTGLLGIANTSSLGYYAGAAVLALPYIKGTARIKPELDGLSFNEIFQINKKGFSCGLTAAFGSLTLAFRATLLNAAIVVYEATDCIQAYNVQVQVNYIFNAFLSASVSTMFLLGCMYTAEQDKKGFKHVMRSVARYELGITLILSLVLYFFEEAVASLYLGDAPDSVYADAENILRAYAVGLLFQMLIMMFANYVQVFGYMISPNILYVLAYVVTPFIAMTMGPAYAEVHGRDLVSCLFYSLALFQLLIILILPLFVIVINRRLIRHREDFYMMPKGFGVGPDDEIEAVITTQDEVMEFSHAAWDFCTRKNTPQRVAYMTSLAVEEMGTNVIKHGFTRDPRKQEHALDARVVYKDGEVIIRLRDNSLNFDPMRKVNSLYKNEDKSRLIGIRMIIAEAKEVTYTTLLDLNNLVVRI